MGDISMVTIDCYDAPTLAEFWGKVLSAPILYDWGEYLIIDSHPAMAMQQVVDPTPGKNRMHVDIEVADLAAEKERIVSLGGSFVAHVEMRGAEWLVMADPEGNQFCIAGRFDPQLV